MSDTYLTAEEVAEKLKVSKSSVYTMARRGQLPCLKLGPKTIRFEETALDKYLRKVAS